MTRLRVRGFSSDVCIDLPLAYMREFIPLKHSHIPMSKSATKWKHFAKIIEEMPSLMNCSVGLLIGYDCSRALDPRKVITGADQETYVIKTDLGWSIVGNVIDCVNSSFTCLYHWIPVKKLPSITPLTCIKVLEADFSDMGPGERGVYLRIISSFWIS